MARHPNPLPWVFLAAFCLISAPAAQAEVELKVLQTVRTGAAPIDAALSHDGRQLYVLTEGALLVYVAESGELRERVAVDRDFDSVRPAPREDQVLLGSRRGQRLELVALDYVRAIHTAGSPSRGPDKAPVELVVFSDFECAACAALAPVIDRVAEAYPEQLKVVFKNFPLSAHRNARAAAAAALAAARQGRFWEFHDALFAGHKDLGPRQIGEAARQAGLDPARLQRDMKDVLVLSALNRDVTDGVKAGVRGTPTVFVNGRLLRDVSPEGFRELIEKELNRRKG